MPFIVDLVSKMRLSHFTKVKETIIKILNLPLVLNGLYKYELVLKCYTW